MFGSTIPAHTNKTRLLNNIALVRGFRVPVHFLALFTIREQLNIMNMIPVGDIMLNPNLFDIITPAWESAGGRS